ncbi:electron transfer flavoprotein alpha subunit apoprotein [Halobacillus karajensis]|uniref:Electron transfer flavoprotein large subunit n=1 Tax=Halobacillus karajensis TaxID=195088 RepID=A0A024P214_9BACI|nr:electron transfer flavoprotein subunit alpha/FixB family protein [Halobacillus karajensis]CDQ19638.1 Electron transfer flavoprotein large subunit [Halobacillus karajensis]CDQ22098.1 Electron transfer flavoprotein large subunit [Halobacillus karajensis]CDQ27939.1 Electron transfer flavoprotein large subunit [Halobacillus karajensis]SEH79078.1 electron transfer flavoprotein alpha subunit apoprotein [Halobacillus karajensis]
MTKVLVLAEAKNGKLRSVSFEVLTVASRLAADGEISACVFGSDAERHSKELSKYGAQTIYIAENEELDDYTPDGYKQALLEVIEEMNPDVILTGHTSIGKDILPRIAARLDKALFSDCINIETDDGIIFTRPIYSGKAYQKKKVHDDVVIATIRPNNMEAVENPVTAEIIKLPVTITDLRAIVKEVVSKSNGKVDLAEAKVVVSGGRGVKSAKGFEPLQELAGLLGGAVGASRGACDANYCDYSLQIGQTGKVVTPDLYIACGISGAVQHLAGMSSSKVIVAINKDPEANIFQVCDYGIVGDLFEVVPLLIEEFKSALEEDAVTN